MDDLITRLEQIALSGNDLVSMSRALGNQHTKAILYDDLSQIQDINVLFNDANTIQILFQIRGDKASTVGHWACLIKNKHGILYYDPYGLRLSEDIRLTGESDWLQNLLANEKVDMNTFRHQLFRDDVNTCGRHTVVRSVFWFMTNAEYNRLVVEPVRNMVNNPDTFVALMTAFLGPGDEVIREFFVNRVS